MNALEWLSTTDKPLVRPVYAVYGDDSYLVRESIRAIAFKLFPDDDERESAISRFPGPATSLANVLDEVSFALKKQKTVIPVLYQDCEIPLRLHRLLPSPHERRPHPAILF